MEKVQVDSLPPCPLPSIPLACTPSPKRAHSAQVAIWRHWSRVSPRGQRTSSSGDRPETEGQAGRGLDHPDAHPNSFERMTTTGPVAKFLASQPAVFAPPPRLTLSRFTQKYGSKLATRQKLLLFLFLFPLLFLFRLSVSRAGQTHSHFGRQSSCVSALSASTLGLLASRKNLATFGSLARVVNLGAGEFLRAVFFTFSVSVRSCCSRAHYSKLALGCARASERGDKLLRAHMSLHTRAGSHCD